MYPMEGVDGAETAAGAGEGADGELEPSPAPMISDHGTTPPLPAQDHLPTSRSKDEDPGPPTQRMYPMEGVDGAETAAGAGEGADGELEPSPAPDPE